METLTVLFIPSTYLCEFPFQVGQIDRLGALTCLLFDLEQRRRGQLFFGRHTIQTPILVVDKEHDLDDALVDRTPTHQPVRPHQTHQVAILLFLISGCMLGERMQTLCLQACQIIRAYWLFAFAKPP